MCVHRTIIYRVSSLRPSFFRSSTCAIFALMERLFHAAFCACLLQMTEKRLFVLFVLSLIISTVLCQTFQYSRGWTNGKRSSLVPNSLDVPNSMDERFTGEPRTVKMLLYGDLNEQVGFRTIECLLLVEPRKFLSFLEFYFFIPKNHM